MAPLTRTLHTTICGAAALYLFPCLYGSLLLLIGFRMEAGGKAGSIAVACSIILGVVCCITSFIGLFGVWGLNEPAIRATVVLVVLENILAFFLAVFLVIHVSRTPKSQAVAARGGRGLLPPGSSTLEGDLLAHRTAAAIVASLVLVTTVLTSCCIGILSEFQATLDAELLLEEARALKEGDSASAPFPPKAPEGSLPALLMCQEAIPPLVFSPGSEPKDTHRPSVILGVALPARRGEAAAQETGHGIASGE